MERPFFRTPAKAELPTPPTTSPEKAANSSTYSQRKQLKQRETELPDGMSLKPETLNPAFAAGLRAKQLHHGVPASKQAAAEAAWMSKLDRGDYSGPTLDRSRYLCMRNATIEGNPRQTEAYRQMCREAVGVGATPDPERYSHLAESDFGVIRWVVSRGSGCMWLPDTPRTTLKGFRHRLITKGPPIRGKLFRLNRADTE